MKRKVGIITVVLSVLLLAIGALVFFVNRKESYRSIQVQEALGTTTVDRAGEGSLEAYQGMKLKHEDRVEVKKDSSLVMKLDRDKYVYAEEETKFQITASGKEKSGKIFIQMENGSALIEIQEKLSGDESFEVQTPNSVLAVRGTVFYVATKVDEQGETVTSVSVFDGAVAAESEGEEQISIMPGKRVDLVGTADELQVTEREIVLEEMPQEVLEWLVGMEKETIYEKSQMQKAIQKVEEPTATSTPVPTVTTSTPLPTATNTPKPTATSTPMPTVTNTPVPMATSTPLPTATSTPIPTATSTPIPTPTKAPVINGNYLTGLDAFEITSQMVIGWNLGNSLDCTGSHITFDSSPARAATAWGNEEATKELFEAVKAAGFNTVRIPTTWYQHIKYDEAKGTYIINEEWLAYVKKTVDYAYELDMFVVLNAHHEDWANVPQFTDATFEKASRILKNIWGTVAEMFADYDQHLIFEGMNEPRQTGLGSNVEWGGGDKESWAYINKLNQVFVDAVRGQGSTANQERLLMLPCYGGSSNIETVKAVEIPKNAGNVAISIHAYFPYFFAMDTSGYANHQFPGKSGYGENYETSINDLFRDLKKVSKEKNTPIVIGEFGASDFNNTADRARWATHFLTKAKEAGIVCIFWDNQATYNGTGEVYGLISRSTYTWFENAIPMIRAAMKVYGRENSLPDDKALEKQSFVWADVPIGEDWVQMFRSDSGQYIGGWGNQWLDNWRPYISSEYDIVLIYDSESEPYMVLQGGWYKIFASKTSDNPYMLKFTFEDVQKTMRTENVKLEDMTHYFASASEKEMILYGIYAVPKHN